jgi:hypothetical protein
VDKIKIKKITILILLLTISLFANENKGKNMFELNNEQRKYLGLELTHENWDRVEIKKDLIVYYDKNKLKKGIVSRDSYYHEWQMDDETLNREFLKPKKTTTKPKKLTPTTIESKKSKGIYFFMGLEYFEIGNYTTDRTFYSIDFEDIVFENFDKTKEFLNDYIADCSDSHLKDLELFKTAKRKKYQIKEGDFFRFKADRNSFGFGRVLFDVNNFRYSEEAKKYPHDGLQHLMGTVFIIKIYHITTKEKDVDIEKLKLLKAIPSQYITDVQFYDGNFEIIGNLSLKDDELDFPISYSSNSTYEDERYVYLQQGKLFASKPLASFNKYLEAHNPFNTYQPTLENPYKKEGVRDNFSIKKVILDNCILNNNNNYYWDNNFVDSYFDLRNPKNKDILNDIELCIKN